MSGETTTTVVGNLTDDPELHHTPVGPVVSFTVATAARVLDRASGEWKDGDPLFLRCSLWHTPAEHAAASLHRGARVIVTGRLRQRSFETPGGEKRTVIELAADEVGASLRFAPTRVRLPLRDASDGVTPASA